MLAVSTVTQQPDVETDFASYARYITTGDFLLSHLVAKMGWGARAVLGVMAAAVFLAAGRARRLALTGAVVTVVANVYMAAAFGSASCVQPGLPRRAPNIQELNADTAYGPALGYAVSLTIFSFSGVRGVGAGTQSVAGLLLMASTMILARRLPRVGTRAADDGEATGSGVAAPPVVAGVERA